METISLKLDENMLKNVDNKLKKHNYSTRTEFIRDAIRDKLEGLTRDELINRFMTTKFKPKKGKGKPDWEQVREQASKELAKEMGWKAK